MDIVFLDQNKWIELAKVEAGKITGGPLVALYSELCKAVERGRVIFPLTASHIIETSKRNDTQSRVLVAQTQAKLSRGHVYRSRAARLIVEMRHSLQRLFGKQTLALPANWVVAPGFFQAFETMDEMVASRADAERTRKLNRYLDPKQLYVDYMSNQDDARRRIAHKRFANGATDLVARIETRRQLLAGDSVDMRRRAYCAALFIEHQDDFIQALQAVGVTTDQLRALGDDAVVKFVDGVPTFNVESEIAARLEASAGSIESNDALDMQSFYTAVPYSSRLVAEKHFISLARQAKLDARYQTKLSQSLFDLAGTYA